MECKFSTNLETFDFLLADFSDGTLEENFSGLPSKLGNTFLFLFKKTNHRLLGI